MTSTNCWNTAALAIEAGCDWITTDRDYARYPGLKWHSPFWHSHVGWMLGELTAEAPLAAKLPFSKRVRLRACRTSFVARNILAEMDIAGCLPDLILARWCNDASATPTVVFVASPLVG